MREWATAWRTTLPGSILMLALVFGPVFWGCTWPLGISILNLMMLGATLSWCLGIFWARPTPAFPRLLVASTAGLLAQGWMMALNASGICDPGTDLFTPRAHLTWLRGAVDFHRALDAMERITGLLGTTMIVSCLGRELAWRRLLLGTIVTVAGGVSFLGCLQRWSHADDIFWGTSRHLDFFFATYRNVTNAGEFLNLALPLAGAVLLLAFMRRDVPLLRTGAVSAWALIVTGVWICGSRLAPGMSLLGFVFLFALTRDRVQSHLSLSAGRRRALGYAVIAGLLVVLILCAGFHITANRFQRLFEPGGGATLIHRWQVDEVCLLASRDGGLAGFGPGSFSAIFPYYSARVSETLDGYWSYAHDDYAQSVVEWGWGGGCLWAGWVLGPMVVLGCRGQRNEWKLENRLMGAGLLSSVGLVAATAAVDFPLQIASIQFEVSVLLGLLWSCTGWESQPSSREEVRQTRARISLPVGAHLLASREVR